MLSWFGRNIRWIAHAGAWTPMALIVFDGLTGTYGANPIQDLTFRTGRSAIVLLTLSLACTPLNKVFNFKPALKVRRALGLYAFMYVTAHFLMFAVVDYGLDIDLVYEAIFEKPYALVGFTALLLLLPLAVTSTKLWQRKLRRSWKKLHRLAYVAMGLALLHFFWVVKSDYRIPLALAVLVGVLLLLRVPAVKRAIASARARRRRRRRPAARCASATRPSQVN